MGTNNRQRRKAKQKAKQARARSRMNLSTMVTDLTEAIEALVDEALHACHTGQEQRLASCVARLDDVPVVGPVDLALQEMMQGAITVAWQAGWQPTDLICAGRRRIDAKAERIVIDMIAAELRGYAAMTVDETWEPQLASMNAVVWWEQDETYLTAWAQRHDADRGKAIGYSLEALYFLELLPQLPTLCQPPGQARRGSLATAGRDVDTRKLERVRALLAKAESTQFPQEADALTAKAQELMARYSIDYALLASRKGTREDPTGRRVAVDNPYEMQKASLIDVVAKANRCRAIWSKELGFCTVLGFPRDVDATEVMFTSLLVQATSELRLAGSQGDGRTTSFRRSFLTAYAQRIGQRLAEAAESAQETAAHEYGGELLPVLASRENAVEATFERLFPQRTSHSTGAPTNRLGWMAGHAAAERAQLGTRHTELGASAP